MSATSVQALPFQLSVFPTFVEVYPPEAIAAVYGPPPHPNLLAPFRSATSVQLHPFQLPANAPFAPGVSPPDPIA